MFRDPLSHHEVQGAVAGGSRHIGEELQHGVQLGVEQLGVDHDCLKLEWLQIIR